MSLPTAIAFLIGQTPDHNGRTMEDYRRFGVRDWDCQHDVIQWAFPTKTVSAFNPHAPVLPAGWEYTHSTSSAAKACVRATFFQYMNSLGITATSTNRGCEFSIDYQEAEWWMTYGNHVLRRFTRIIECLNLFENWALASDFTDFLIYELAFKNPHLVNVQTLAFWVAARDNKLHRVQ